ncbi:unnamed protein product [Brassicogethes aeneus]|uniref:Uncharacterized protein n=1 Tax=Brassicogethes aeneus TaxID=1431903 RepID=A0A9P0FGC0_BRAAE|nr:unnamed protein product [Brassicogethes aeneus]
MSTSSIVKATKLRFTISDDLFLLNKVIESNPYDDGLRWKAIRNAIVEDTGKNFTVRATREHVDHLLKLFIKSDYYNLRKSATDDQYEQKILLLKQISDYVYLKNERNGNGLELDNEINATSEHIKIEVEEATLEDINSQEDDITEQPLIESETPINNNLNSIPSSKTNPRASAILVRRPRKRIIPSTAYSTYFQYKRDSENKLREKELDLEERKLAAEERRINLEELKFAQEKTEKEQRLQIELEERRHRLKLETQQQEIYTLLIQFLINKK